LEEIQIEKFQKKDICEIIELFYRTIESVNNQDYTKDQILAWQGKEHEAKRKREWSDKLRSSQTYLARNSKNQLVGFLEFTQLNELNLFFVHHDYQRKGIGKQLFLYLMKELKKKSSEKITANVSITARPFFESLGFISIKEQVVQLNGQEFINYKMEKSLNKH